MKITMVIAVPNLSGGARVTAELAEHMIKRGHEVLAVCARKQPPTLKQQFKSLIKGEGWISNPIRPPSHFYNVNFPLRVLDHVGPIVDDDLPDADVVVANFWLPAEWVANLSEKKGAKVHFVQGHEVSFLSKERSAAIFSLPMHKVAVSKWLIDLMRNKYGDDNVSLVPNSVNTKVFYAPPRAKQAIPTVGLMYSTADFKGCDISLKAFCIAAGNITNLRLVAFGTGEPSETLPLPVGTRYFQQPPQNTIKDIYAQCDAWLFGSRREGFGLPILEAMACRTPVIGTPAGAAPELLSDGAGILVKPEDPEDMARAIEQICTMSETEWRAMSDAAYSKVTSYTWDDATELFEKALYTAIERSKKGDFSSVTPPESA